MSVHAMIAAAYVEDLAPSTKLVLMAIADSSDEHTREAAPGLPKLRAWSNLSKRQTLRVVAELEAAGYLTQIVDGQRGRRAVWRVFPAGVPGIPRPSEIEARYSTIPNVDNDEEPVDNPDGKGVTDDTQSDGKGVMQRHLGCHPRHPFITDSVHKGSTPQKSTGPRVDKPTPSASTASGFPGARKAAEVDDAAGIARRARGANDRPCPVGDHGAKGEIHGGCGRCAHEAANADPEHAAAARRSAREAIARSKITTTTATEETRTA